MMNGHGFCRIADATGSWAELAWPWYSVLAICTCFE